MQTPLSWAPCSLPLPDHFSSASQIRPTPNPAQFPIPSRRELPVCKMHRSKWFSWGFLRMSFIDLPLPAAIHVSETELMIPGQPPSLEKEMNKPVWKGLGVKQHVEWCHLDQKGIWTAAKVSIRFRLLFIIPHIKHQNPRKAMTPPKLPLLPRGTQNTTLS